MTGHEPWQRLNESGKSAFGRGLYELALAEYMKACDYARQTNDQTSLASSLRGMAKACLELEKVSQAKQCALEAEAIDCQFWGDESEAVYKDIFLQAEALRIEGNLVEARNLLQKTLSFRVQFFGDVHEETLVVIMRLIWVSLEEGRFDGLVKLTQHAAEIFARLHPPGTFGTSLNLALLIKPYLLNGRLLEAELICERTLQLLQTVIGDRNADIVAVMNDYTEVMKRAKKHLAAWHMRSRSELMSEAQSLERQAEIFSHAGDFPKAEILYRQLLANLRKRTAPSDLLVSRALKNYAEVIFRQGRANDAQNLKRLAEKNSKRLSDQVDLLFWF